MYVSDALYSEEAPVNLKEKKVGFRVVVLVAHGAKV